MNKEELEIDNKRLDFNEKVQLVVKKEELKEQDIRLNKLCFDYQEKEKRIVDLEAQNKELTLKISRLESDCDAYNYSQRTYQEKIKELKAENEQIKNSDTLCKLIGEQKRKITELEAQIEIMKNCGNCKNFSPTYGLCCYSLGDEDYDCRLRKWEIKEK